MHVHILAPDRPDGHQDRSDAAPADEDVVAARLQEEILRTLGRALTIRHVDAGSCNGCELEIHALMNPYYNIEGLGIRFVASPRHADVLLVTGPVSKHMAIALAAHLRRDARAQARGRGRRMRLHRRHLRRKLCDASAASRNVIPVDVAIPGCPPTPTALLQGILAAIQAAAPPPVKMEPSMGGDEAGGRRRAVDRTRRRSVTDRCRSSSAAQSRYEQRVDASHPGVNLDALADGGPRIVAEVLEIELRSRATSWG